MPTIINATGFHRVANQNLNQRVRSETVTLRNGNQLDIAIVSTGFGPDGDNARAAHMVLDAIIVNVKRTPNMSVPVLLEHALKNANHELYW